MCRTQVGLQFIGKHGEKTIAVLTPLRIHPFKKDELPTLTFYADVSNEEMVFLMLILAYPDLKLPTREKPPVQYSPAFDVLLVDSA